MREHDPSIHGLANTALWLTVVITSIVVLTFVFFGFFSPGTKEKLLSTDKEMVAAWLQATASICSALLAVGAAWIATRPVYRSIEINAAQAAVQIRPEIEKREKDLLELVAAFQSAMELFRGLTRMFESRIVPRGELQRLHWCSEQIQNRSASIQQFDASRDRPQDRNIFHILIETAVAKQKIDRILSSEEPQLTWGGDQLNAERMADRWGELVIAAADILDDVNKELAATRKRLKDADVAMARVI
ncbi:hypothetical protein [Chelatococcus asaccharovorans]|uniref:hypothetical protein n=1 Tax=Chelatococcus asaccharovorans TaxID=28210 RepID=UPI0022642A3E|nr:hypothetical protein [Chelatococcus asaccharovorans]